ncbi:hypothetical protein [Pinirhizobacter soli]|uniref:hypothetical protein n=1 Tax=Pinirhizobacter soli TaxID=2786953 RepID=UPI002029D595|nr:hypothetical protein [Pinirhizobacter soli]
MLLATGLPPALPNGPRSPGGEARSDGPMAIPPYAVSNQPVLGLHRPGAAASGNIHHAGNRPAFYLDKESANRLHRAPISPGPAKPYRGFFRLHQSLRHVCIAINMTMKAVHHVDPLEVQASVIGDRLHLCSNFHVEKVVDSLRAAFCDVLPPDNAVRRVPRDIRDWDQVITARRWRHVQKLKETFASERSIALTIEKASREIESGIGLCKGTNLSTMEIIHQCASGFRTILAVLQDLRNVGHSNHVEVCYPLSDPSLGETLPPGITQTMHAEQCIEEYIATHSDHVYGEATRTLGLHQGKHVVVPMAGRFVPCAPCAEVEHHAMREGGFFDPARNRFVLCRSTSRIGRAFPREVQHIALHVLSPDDPFRAQERASWIRDQFTQGGQDLISHGAPVVLDYSLDTDSESSCDEGGL